MFVKRFGDTAPADILRKDSLFFGSGKTIVKLTLFQHSDRFGIPSETSLFANLLQLKMFEIKGVPLRHGDIGMQVKGLCLFPRLTLPRRCDLAFFRLLLFQRPADKINLFHTINREPGFTPKGEILHADVAVSIHPFDLKFTVIKGEPLTDQVAVGTVDFIRR